MNYELFCGAKIKHFSCFPKNIMEKFDLYDRIYFVGKPPSKDFFCRKGSQLGSVTLKDFSFEITSKPIIKPLISVKKKAKIHIFKQKFVELKKYS